MGKEFGFYSHTEVCQGSAVTRRAAVLTCTVKRCCHGDRVARSGWPVSQAGGDSVGAITKLLANVLCCQESDGREDV